MIAAAAAIILFTAGCESHDAQQGERNITASYLPRTLTTDLPEPARVPAVIAAAESALRDRGYTIASSATTADRGTVEALPPHEGDRVRITAEAAGSETRTTIQVGDWGDESVSRAILDGMLTRLGL